MALGCPPHACIAAAWPFTEILFCSRIFSSSTFCSSLANLCPFLCLSPGWCLRSLVRLRANVCVSQDAAKIAKDSKVKIFTADIIYHLFDQFTKHMAETREEERKQLVGKGIAVFPVQLKIMPLNIFNKRNPVRFLNNTSAYIRVPSPSITATTSLLCPLHVFFPRTHPPTHPPTGQKLNSNAKDY